jgi:flagellar motor switch protein FliG
MHKNQRNLRKAAILVASLEIDQADALLRQLPEEQAELVRGEAARLGALDPREQRDVLEEFFRIGPLVPAKHQTGIELDGRLPRYLSVSSAARELDSLELSHAVGERPFRVLHQASAHALLPLLTREHPQTIAVVVSHLPNERAAEVLAGLPTQLQLEVARRLVDLEETDPEIVAEIERELESWLCEDVRSRRRKAAGITALANILGAASPQTKEYLLANLTEGDRTLAAKILRPAPEPEPLSFVELATLDRKSLQAVMRSADPELIVLALAGADHDFGEKVLSLLPRREAAAFERALRDLGPTRLTDVEDAQTALADLASRMAAHGEIQPVVRGRLSLAV